MELGVRYYDNSGSSGTIAGGEEGMLREHGYRERAKTYKDSMMGSHPEYTGVRFMRKAPLMLEVKVSSRSTIRRIAQKTNALSFLEELLFCFQFYERGQRDILAVESFRYISRASALEPALAFSISVNLNQCFQPKH